MNALLGLFRKECFHILRDRRTLMVIILMPVLQVILFGSAIRTDIEDIRLVIVDPAPDATTIAIRQRFDSNKSFRTVAVTAHSRGLANMFESGAAQQAIVFQSQFADRLARGLPAGVLVITDATDPNSGSSMENYASAVIRDYEQELQRTTPGIRIVAQQRMRFNPTGESANLFIPGLIAFVLTIISALMTAISLTREKETGTMEALLVSPLRPLQIVVGKVAPYVIIGFVSVLAVILEARLVFGVPMRGNMLLLLAEGVLFIIVTLSIGIMISTRTSSQRVAMMGAMVGTMLPTMLLSGFIFPIESLPWPLRIISYAIPARWFVFITRGIMLKGVGLEVLWRETLILAAMGVVLMRAGAHNLKIRLE